MQEEDYKSKLKVNQVNCNSPQSVSALFGETFIFGTAKSL